MSLETVLSLGRLYRKSVNSKDYHEQINKVSKDIDAIKKKKDADGNLIQTTFFRLPVTEQADGSFVFQMNEIDEITDEDKIASLYYLNFKTSSKDSTKLYLFGDVIYNYFPTKNGVDEGGNYRLIGKNSSFVRCEELATSLTDTVVGRFRAEYSRHREQIEKLLLSLPSVVLHFDFNGKSWYDFDGITDLINEKLLESFVSKHPTGGVFLEKYLYKTLGGTTPGFGQQHTYKTRIFTPEEVQDLMYAIALTQKPILRIKGIGVVALPKGANLTVGIIEKFVGRSASEVVAEEDDAEERLEFANQPENDADNIFAALTENDLPDTVQYDIILLSIPSSPAGVYADLVEVSSVQKSLLVAVSERVQKVRRDLRQRAKAEFQGKLKVDLTLDLKFSFLKILSDRTKNEKKYQFHLLKVLPQIYTDTYYEDPLLLPAFIEKVESNIRNSGQGFSTFKYDFYFLMLIQKQDNLMQITETKSYTIGQCLGTMAKQFAAWRDDCPIKSFEKSYVGNLTRRISSLDDVTVFCDFLNQKLTIHDRLYPDVKKAFLQLTELVRQFDERYNKHHCSLGFFESYYTIDQKQK